MRFTFTERKKDHVLKLESYGRRRMRLLTGTEDWVSEPRTPHGNYRTVSRDNVGAKIIFLFKRCDILVSEYPDSFVKF